MKHSTTNSGRVANRRPGLGRTTVAFAAAVLGATALAGCGSAAAPDAAAGGAAAVVHGSSGDSPYKAVALGNAITRPDLTLTDTSGQPYDLLARTSGHATLLYFGYTHCPDVCPTTMSDLAVALHRLPAAERAKVDVVFVTTDPDRDTGPVIRAWLDKFDPSFVGLTGALPAITAAAKSVGIPVEPPVKQADGGYTVAHGAELLAFSPDGPARVAFLSDATVNDMAHDLPLLVEGRRP
jgi:protein SCO1/2